MVDQMPRKQTCIEPGVRQFGSQIEAIREICRVSFGSDTDVIQAYG